MTEKPRPDDVVPLWFYLRDQMMKEGGQAINLRPPSLRDACYAATLSHRGEGRIEPETVEAFVNGLELGALTAIRLVWEDRYGID